MKYIILGWAASLGGGQVYTKNKCNAVQKMGMEPVVYYALKKEITIPDLKKHKSKCLPTLNFLPSFFSKAQREYILNTMIQYLDLSPGEECFVESNDIRYSCWGELLAERLNCKHFAFVLEAYFPKSGDNIDFFKFKLKRWELAGTRPASLPSLFRNRIDLQPEECRVMKAFCTNTVDDAKEPIPIDEKLYDIKIAHVGRTTKPYVKYLYDDIIPFLENHTDKKILLLFIGGEANDKNNLAFAQKLSAFDNVTVVFTGLLLPIPRSYMQKMDVCIGSSGCLRISSQTGAKVIGYLDEDVLPFGLLGYEVKEVPVSKRVSNLSLSEYLERVFFQSYYDDAEFVNPYPFLDVSIIEKELISATKEIMEPCELEYYDTTTILSYGMKKLYQKTLGRVIPMSYILLLLKKLKTEDFM